MYKIFGPLEKVCLKDCSAGYFKVNFLNIFSSGQAFLQAESLPCASSDSGEKLQVCRLQRSQVKLLHKLVVKCNLDISEPGL